MSVNIEDTRLIIFDIDGTIINDEKVISTNLINLVRRLRDERGIRFALASSRPPQSIEKVWEEMGATGCYLAFDGGIVVTETGSTLGRFRLDKEGYGSLISYVEAKSLTLSIFTERDWFSTNLGYWTQREIRGTRIRPNLLPLSDIVGVLSDRSTDIYKIMVRGNRDDVAGALESIKDEPFSIRNRCYSDRPTMLEVVSRDADKLTGCNKICDFYGIKQDGVMYFGDGLNDLTCMRNFRYSVAVQNAHELVLRNAKFITSSNNDDGVFTFLRTNLLCQ